MSSEPEDQATGRARGGHARADRLSKDERVEIAKRAAQARWEGPVVLATHGDPDHPLQIGDARIPCYVLEDGRRVLNQSSLVAALGMSHGGSYSRGGDRLAKFVGQDRLKPFVSQDLIDRTVRPIKFKAPNGKVSYGYEATVLADICESVLAARKANNLMKQQEHIATQCEILIRGFARVGIIALVDEVTGYQRDRASDALARILEAFIAKELRVWVQTFPADFYQELFRLRGLDFPTGSVKRPQYFGKLTNDIVYKRLAPGVLEKLKEVTERNDAGRPKHKLFQRLTSNIGYPKLREHLGSVVTIMKLSDGWKDFTQKLDRLHPRYGNTLSLPLDDGKGL